MHDNRRRRDAPPRPRALLNRRPDRLLDHHQGLVALPHPRQQRQPQGRRRESVQLPEPDMVVVHLPVFREERSGQPAEALRLADSASSSTVEARVVFLPASVPEIGAVADSFIRRRRGDDGGF